MYILLFFPAVQNERQPRNSAQVRQEQLEAELDNPLVAAATVSATHPAFAPNNNHHRFMAGLTPTEHHTKVEHDEPGE